MFGRRFSLVYFYNYYLFLRTEKLKHRKVELYVIQILYVKFISVIAWQPLRRAQLVSTNFEV